MSRGEEASALGPEERALLQVANEERHLPGPEIDAELVESRVLRKITAEAPPRRRAPKLPVAIAAAFLVAAGVAVSFGLKHHGTQAASSASAEHTQALAGEKLALGEIVVAGASPLTVEHAGHARWTLSKGSRATLERRDSVVVVRLLAGELEADVLPRPVPETFVVEASTVRAAVHGTHFVVKYRSDGVYVGVSDGVVMVTRQGTGDSTPLRAPADQTFVVDEQPPSAAPAVRSPSSPVTPPHAAARPAAHVPAAPGAALPEEPPISAVEAGVSEVVSAVQRCFVSSSTADSEVQVSVRSTVSFRVLPNGELRDIRFEPPLSPNATACARAELGAVRFSESRQGIALSRVLELER